MKKTKSFLILALLFGNLLLAIPIFTVNAQTLIWSGDAYSSGELETGPVLTAGRTYLIIVSGMFWYDYPNNLAADAQYYTTSGVDSWNWENHLIAPDGHSFLQVGGTDQSWGPFLGGHGYGLNYVGTGDAVTFQIIDWIDGDYNNNHCHLIIEIFEYPSEDYSGLTPGFWKNHPAVWPDEYETGTLFKEVFGETGTAYDDLTLLQALAAKGGVVERKGMYSALVRHAVAGVLNAAHDDVNYPMTVEEIVDAVKAAMVYDPLNPSTWNDAATLKDDLCKNNQIGGGIDAHGNPI